jgi:hypothetical protein
MFSAIFLSAIGAVNLIWHRSIGRELFSWSQTTRRKAGKFWQQLGTEGIARLYLALGIIFCSGGLLLLSMSVWGSHH